MVNVKAGWQKMKEEVLKLQMVLSCSFKHYNNQKLRKLVREITGLLSIPSESPLFFAMIVSSQIFLLLFYFLSGSLWRPRW